MMHPPGDQAVADTSQIDDDGTEEDTVAEEEEVIGDLSLPADQKRHLMELESSFRIDSGFGSRRISGKEFPRAPFGKRGKPIEDSLKETRESLEDVDDLMVFGSETDEDHEALPPSIQRARSGTNSSLVANVGVSEGGNTNPVSPPSPESDILSSPAAAAHARIMCRASSSLSKENAEAEQERRRSEREQVTGDAEQTRSEGLQQLQSPLARGENPIDHQPSYASLQGGVGVEDTGQQGDVPLMEPQPVVINGQPALTTALHSNSDHNQNPNQSGPPFKRKPKFLRSRNTSQRSSISSISDMHGLYDEDEASTILAAGERQPLSRQTSLGSIASGITALGGGGSVYGGAGADRAASGAAAAAAPESALARLDEEERSRLESAEEKDPDAVQPDADAPSTPKERTPPIQPTDTVIAAQVKRIKIPPTVTREYSRQMGPPGSPSKKAVAAAGTPAPGRGREMTLKEQTASIDRLQKENFDLKIKVYYLNEKLEKQSDESVKEALQENVDMKVKLAEGIRERKALKKCIRELEKKIEELGGEKRKEEEEAAAETEEVWELREKVERYRIEIEEYRRRETEQEERMRSFYGRSNGRPLDEELDTMRHVLASEISRRETAEAENLRLREEIYRLRAQEGPTISRTSTRGSDREHSQSRADRNLVAQIGQVRHENEELRREVSAQTSMLTSRNREKERLYAEIEDLKLTMRGGGSGAAFESASRAPSVFSDRLLDRSVSRAGGAASVAGTNVTALTETEREDFENTNGALRDRISELRIKNQDLEQQLDTCYAELDQRQAMMHQLEDEVELAHAEVQEMQAERNDALRMREEMELDFEQLKDEAEEELRRLEEEIDLRGSEILRLEEEARLKEEDFRGLQQEMRNVSDVVVRLEDQQEGHQGETRRYEEKIQELQQTIQGNEQEMNVLENTLRESTEKIERLSVQGESAKSEIVFLREEQDGDKIRIGELESTIKYLEMAVVEEKEKVRETRQQVEAERKEREQHGDIKQQEWERRLNEKSGEVTKYKDEIRRLRGKVTNREDEAKTWRERLEDLERSLREALGDLSGTRAGLMKSVLNLQHELDSTLEELDFTKNELTEKDRVLKDRENLLESMALESRKLTDLLEKERSARKLDKQTLESLHTTTSQHTRRITEHQTQFTELEKQRHKEAKTLKQLEEQYREQISERNNLLAQIWSRLSIVCGADWAQRNSTVSSSGSSSTPSVNAGKFSMEEAITSVFPSFARNLLSAVKTIESIVAGFKTRCRGVERDLWKRYQEVESALESRTRRVERLEGLIRGNIGESSQSRAEVAKLRTENRLLKMEINVLRAENASNPTASNGGPSNGGAAEPSSSHDAKQQPSITRCYTSASGSSQTNSKAEMSITRTESNQSIPKSSSGAAAASSSDGGEKRWIMRLRELEKRLKQEREARVLDRSMANQKIQQTWGEKEEIRKELERQRVKSEQR